MTPEDGMRDLAGYGGPHEVTFMGETFAIAADGLIPLLRFAGSGPGKETATDEEARTVAMSAMYGLLEECLTDFPRFCETALSAKAGMDDVTAVMQRLVEFYCARSHWPARRLLAFMAGELNEFDGKALLRSGRGIAGLSAREACNLALAICLDGRDEEDRAFFLEDLNYEGNSEDEAMAMVRQMIAAKAEASAQAAEAEADGGSGDRLGPEGP